MISIQIFTFSPFAENTYLLINEAKEAIIIDPGCYNDAERSTLKNYLDSNGLKPVQLLQTHCHIDHVFGTQWVYQHYALEAFIHPNEEQLLNFAVETAKWYGLQADKYTGPVHFLNHRDVIAFGADTLHVLLAPGHSPGSVCFYHEQQQFIISGDVLFRESIGRTDLPGGNHQALMQSIVEQLFTLPDTVTVYPGHGGPTTIAHEKKHNPYLEMYRS